jgi:hypothetical protein
MTDKPRMADRRTITFAQAEGVEPLPQPLKLGEVSKQLRALLWDAVFRSMSDSHDHCGGIADPWRMVLLDIHVNVRHEPVDEFDFTFHIQLTIAKQICWHGSYIELFGFLQEVLRHEDCPFALLEGIDAALRQSRAAYTIVDGDTIAPAATKEEGAAIQQAFANLAASELHGAREHLRKASDAINSGHYADSVRESIHAVESVARTLEPKASTLEPALAVPERKGVLHPALKQGFSKIYGYTSDEQGIRHALVDDAAADVDIHDAVFMLGACASFITYLIGNARDAGVDLSSKKA